MVSSVSSTDSSAWTTLQKQLAAADANGDGVISKDELASALSNSSTASELIAAADDDGDGQISLSEFISFADKFSSATGLALLSTQETDAAAVSLFATIDTDGSATLSASELRSAASVLSDTDSYADQVASLAAAASDSSSITVAITPTSSTYTESDDVKKMIDEIDRNGDGTFDAKDVAMMLLEADGSIKAPPSSDQSSSDTLLNELYQLTVGQAKVAAEAASSNSTTTDSTSST